MTPRLFADRCDAGRALAAAVAEGAPGPVIVIGVARGGVPVAAEVARALDAPLDVMVVRKVGHPRLPELALGAVTADGTFTPSGVAAPDVSAQSLDSLIDRAVSDAVAMEGALRGSRPGCALDDERVLVVDDGVATGASLRAALRAARARGAAVVVAATPVASPRAVRALAGDADEVICPQVTDALEAVGQAYDDFAPVSTDDVMSLLGSAGRAAA